MGLDGLFLDMQYCIDALRTRLICSKNFAAGFSTEMLDERHMHRHLHLLYIAYVIARTFLFFLRF